MHILFLLTTVIGTVLSIPLNSPTITEVGSKVISCEASSPSAELFWTAPNGKKIEYSPTENIFSVNQNGKLYLIALDKLDEKALYICNENDGEGRYLQASYGMQRAEHEDFVVEGVNTLEVTENSVVFDITLTNSSPVSDYEISVLYNETEDSAEKSVQWGPGDKLEIRDLIANGRYDFRFRVGKEDKYGPWSGEHQVVLLPGVPDVLVRSFKDGNFGIQFPHRISDVMRDTIDKYRVTYRRLQMESGERWIPSKCNMAVEVPRCMFSTYTINNLMSSNTYEVLVEAHTAAGYGQPYRQKIYVP